MQPSKYIAQDRLISLPSGEKTGFSFLIDSVALMNHSCCPNVIVTYKGTLAEVRAVQEISPGEEVSVRLAAAVAVGFQLWFYRAIWKILCGRTGQGGLGVIPAADQFLVSGPASQ